MTSSLRDQALAVERAAVNQRGHVNNLRALVERNRRPFSELEQQEAWTPALEDAARTLRKIADMSP